MAEQAAQEVDPQATYEQSDSAPKADPAADLEKTLKALESERKERKETARRAAELEKRLGELEPKEKQFQERLTALESELKNERLNALKSSVAAEKGVPVSALVGESREDLESFADQLLAWRGEPSKPKPTTGLKSGASNADSRLDPMEKAAQALRRLRNNE